MKRPRKIRTPQTSPWITKALVLLRAGWLGWPGGEETWRSWVRRAGMEDLEAILRWLQRRPLA